MASGFGIDKFGQTPWGTASFEDFYFENLPRVYHELDADGVLERFLNIVGRTSDEIKYAAERIWWLYDFLRCREDILYLLARNFGVDGKNCLPAEFLRRFLDYIGRYVKTKGRIQAIKNVLQMLGFGNCEVWELYELERLNGDATNGAMRPYYTLRVGDSARIGKNQFFWGEWKYCIGTIGWFRKSDLFGNVPRGPVKIEDELQEEPLSQDMSGALNHSPVYERYCVLKLKDANGSIKERICDTGYNQFTGRNLRSRRGSYGTLNYETGAWTLHFSEPPAAGDQLYADYVYGEREIYQTSLLRIGVSRNLTEQEQFVMKFLCGLIVPCHIGVVDVVRL